MNRQRRNRMTFRKIILHPLATFLSEFVFIVTSFSFLGSFITRIANCIAPNKNPECIDRTAYWISWVIILLWALAVFFKVWQFAFSRTTYKEYRKMQISEELSAAMLRVQQKSNEYKARHVKQITYGSVPTWHPFNYRKNVLVYDVHEQIRTILNEIKDAILSTIPELDDDAITVDLTYCYIDKNCDGRLPTKPEESKQWKIITSGDCSSMNCSIHKLLSNDESFYFYLDRNNFAFINDKENADRYYIPVGKDREYGSNGSITGLSITIKNDEPEEVLLKAMLTITTFGRKFVEKEDGIDEEEYKDLFKKNIMNGCKSLLESELTQMYIRHMIRKGKMCPYSGITFRPKNKKSKP